MDGDGLVCTFSLPSDGIQDGGDRSSSGSRHLVWRRPSSFNRDVAVEVAARGELIMYSSHVLHICLLAVALITNAYGLYCPFLTCSLPIRYKEAAADRCHVSCCDV